VKDDPNEVAMHDQKQKPSIWTIAVIFAAAMVLVLLLVWTPKSSALCSERFGLINAPNQVARHRHRTPRQRKRTWSGLR